MKLRSCVIYIFACICGLLLPHNVFAEISDIVSPQGGAAKFRPYGYIQLEDGINISMQEGAKFTSMLSPSVNIAGGCNFTPIFGARVAFGYGQGRGEVPGEKTFSYQFLDLFADATFDMRNVFQPYEMQRRWTVYPYAGIGMLIGLENTNPAIDPALMPVKWEPVSVFFAGRIGVVGDVYIAAGVHALLDLNVTMADKNLRSGISDRITSQFVAKVGLSYSFEGFDFKKKPKKKNVELDYSKEARIERKEAKAEAKAAAAAAVAATAAATGVSAPIAIAAMNSVGEVDTVYTFHPWAYVFLEDGVSISLQQNGNFMQQVAPAFNVGFGYNFTPVFGARMTIGFGQGRNWIAEYKKGYSYKFIELMADVTFDLRNMFEPYRPERLWNLYAFGGIGPLFGLETANAESADIEHKYLQPWAPGKVFFAGRVGSFVSFNVAYGIQLFTEVNFTFAGKELNSCLEGTPTTLCYVKLGVGYSFEKVTNSNAAKGRKSQIMFSNYRTNVSIGTNFIDYVTLGTLNVDANINVSRHVTLGLGGKYNPWVFNRDSESPIMDNQKMAYITAKYYPWYVFDGWNFSFLMGWQNYRTGGITRKEIEEGDRIGAGLGFGYSLILSKNMNLEFGAGFWMGGQNSKLYDKLDGNRTCLEENNKFFFLPSNITIGISWVLNSGKTAKHNKACREIYK